MEIIGNAVNGSYMRNLTKWADSDALEGISLAVAYVASMDEIFELSKRRKLPLRLWALADGNFPYLKIMRRFQSGPPSWQMMLTRDFFHSKIMWFEGVGMYIGSANLTDTAWAANLECGVWFSQAEIVADSTDTRMRAMLAEITKRSSPLDDAHVAAYERIETRRKQLYDQTRSLDKFIGQELAAIAGHDKPIDPTLDGGGIGATA
jgi:phosphatidylserine/phosphatidylglycerophosphate/cardiolipin synthase-like enzyme